MVTTTADYQADQHMMTQQQRSVYAGGRVRESRVVLELYAPGRDAVAYAL